MNIHKIVHVGGGLKVAFVGVVGTVCFWPTA